MICSSEQPSARGGFECSDAPGPEPIARAPIERTSRSQRRAERETLRELGPSCAELLRVHA